MMRVSADPYTDRDTQHATEVEPDTFAYGSTVVSAFQAGRANGGGADGIGFATSLDRGQTWRSGFLPHLTVWSTPPGTASRVSDPSVAYDPIHRMWLIASLLCPPPPKGCGPGPIELVVSRSSDGVTWGGPVLVSVGGYDKSWIVCDDWSSSTLRGTCYASWTDVRERRTLTSSSIDGGLTWRAPQPADRMLGVQPVVQPNGTLVITGEDERARTIVAIRSTDGGRTFERAVIVAHLGRSNRRGFRTEHLPSSEVDAAGTVYVAWEDCRFSPRCEVNGIVLSSSTDGRAWSGAEAVLPGLGVDRTSSGSTARLALTFYSFVEVPCSPGQCRLEVGFVSSKDGGRTWSAVRDLTAVPFPLAWLPQTTLGRMAGDYISTSFTDGSVVTVFPVAASPGPRFDVAMYAAAIPQ